MPTEERSNCPAENAPDPHTEGSKAVKAVSVGDLDHPADDLDSCATPGCEDLGSLGWGQIGGTGIQEDSDAPQAEGGEDTADWPEEDVQDAEEDEDDSRAGDDGCPRSQHSLHVAAHLSTQLPAVHRGVPPPTFHPSLLQLARCSSNPTPAPYSGTLHSDVHANGRPKRKANHMSGAVQPKRNKTDPLIRFSEKLEELRENLAAPISSAALSECRPSSSSGSRHTSSFRSASSAPSVPLTPSSSLDASHLQSDGVLSHSRSVSPPLPSAFEMPATPTGARSPHWGESRLLLRTASPCFTRPVLEKAQLYYKMFILLKHPFPELVDQRCLFARQAWGAAQGDMQLEDGVTLKFCSEVENAIHTIGISFRGSTCSQLRARVPIEYNFYQRPPDEAKRMIEGLLEQGSFTYAKVYFDDTGAIRHFRGSTDIVREGAFGHPLVEAVILQMAFRGRHPIAAKFPKHFNPIPLEFIAFACTLIHHALKQHLSNKPGGDRRDFAASVYLPIYDGYLAGLTKFAQTDKRVCSALRTRLWEAGMRVANIPPQYSAHSVSFTSPSAEMIAAELAAQGASR